MIITAGIDIGKKGAVVVLANGQLPLLAQTTPTIKGEYMIQSMASLLRPFALNAHLYDANTIRVFKAVVDSCYSASVDSTAVHEMACLVREFGIKSYDSQILDLLLIEVPIVMQGEGRTSGRTTGEGAGLWRGMASALQIPYRDLHSRTWTSFFKAGSDKEVHKSICEKEIPLLADFLQGKLTDGIADAALMALYGFRTFSGK